jgi:hypothetical protein
MTAHQGMAVAFQGTMTNDESTNRNYHKKITNYDRTISWFALFRNS